jgi:enoyl-CoA hydratase/carnithine racemase
VTDDRSVLFETHGRVALITLNRPERLNAVDQRLWDQLDEALSRFELDDSLWAAVITGAGRAFCAGADLGDIDRTGLGEGVLRPPERLYQLALGGIWKPVIAAINGYALAAGWWIAQSCDVRIAGASAQLGIPETRWNLRADFVSDLTRVVGLGHALEIAMWGDRRMTARRAFEVGFVNLVVADDQVLDEALDWAERVCRLGPRSVAHMKETIYRAWGTPIDVGSALHIELTADLESMDDTREGPAAFLEHRSPQFRNC